jgi:hypothetical protein
MYLPDTKMRQSNGLRLSAFDAPGGKLDERTFFSVDMNGQIEHAAEIAIEHNPRMTCDRRTGADSLHRAQRDGRGEGGTRFAHRAQ